MSIASKNLSQSQKKVKERDLIIKQHELDYKVLADKFTALETEHDTQTQLLTKIKRGGMFYYESNGFVYNINNVEGYFKTTFPQEEIETFNTLELINIMQTLRYKQYPFVKIENGTFIIDRENYRKYRGGL